MLPPPEEAACCSSTLLNVSSGQNAAAPPPRSVASVPRAYHLLWFSPPYPLQSSTSENVNLLGKEPLGCSSSLVASTPAPLCVPYSQLHPTLHVSVSRSPRASSLSPCLHPCVQSGACFRSTMLLFTEQAPVCPTSHSMSPAFYFAQNSIRVTAISISSHKNPAKQALSHFRYKLSSRFTGGVSLCKAQIRVMGRTGSHTVA